MNSMKLNPLPSFSLVATLFLISSIENEYQTTSAFTLQPKSIITHPTKQTNHHHPYSTQLYDLSEWRDQFFEVPKDVTEFIETQLPDDDKKIIEEPIREICVLPFPLDDVLLQGETKELCLYEDRFHQLFETSTKCHNSVVAMGLLAPPAGILQNMPLCEIENYRVMQGQTAFGTDFSILVTIRVVGRASLLYIQDEDDDLEYLKGWCVEINDEDTDDDIIDVGNQLADRMDGLITDIQIMEDRLMLSSGSMTKQDGSVNDSIDSSGSDASMKRRILEAELEDDEDDDDEDDDDEDDDECNNRRQRLTRAFEVAKATDFQGYTLTKNDSNSVDKSIQDLTALSWAYFCCDNDPLDVISYRLRAIESVDLCERMELALSMMKERKIKLTKLLKDGTIDSRSNDEEDEDEGRLLG